MTYAPGTCPYVPLSEYNWQIVPLLSETRGACHGITLQWNPTVVCLFAAMHAVSVWTSLGLNVQAVFTFKKWSTVYFWSIIITAWGIILYAVSLDLMFFTLFGNMLFLGSVLYPLAWVVTNTGFLMVLYSRLHLLLNSPKVLRTLLVLIIGVCIPLQIVFVVSGTGYPHHHLGEGVWHVTVRLEMLFVFFEIILSALYVYLFARFIRQGSSDMEAHLKRTFYFLIFAEILVVAGDVVIVTLWYTELYLMRLALSPFLYALKLQIEFMVLNRLTHIGTRRNELRHIAVSTTSEEASVVAVVETALPFTFEPAPIAKPEEIDLESGTVTRVSTGGERKRLSNEIQEVSTSMTRAGSARRYSFDNLERRYLGRFTGTKETC